MEVLRFLAAVSPIAVVLTGILAFKKKAATVAPIALCWTVFLAFTFFNVKKAGFSENVLVIDALLWKGLKEGLKIVLMVFGAFIILNMLKASEAIEDVKNTVARVGGSDRRVQLIIVGMSVPIFLEGAAGAGSPAAIAAPFLTALGFDPITAIAVALLGDATPCSWGGAGLTTITGGKYLVDEGLSTTALNSAMVGRIHMFGVLVIPFIMVAITFGKKGFRGIIPYLTYAGVTTGAVMFVLSNYVGPEITSMGTGFAAILLTVLYVRLVPIKTPAEYSYGGKVAAKGKYSAWRALSPYLAMLVLLPAVRYGVPAIWPEKGFAVMCTFGYIVWVDAVILVCGLIGCIALGLSKTEFKAVCSQTAKSIMPVLITMGSLLVVSYIMQSESTGMMSLISGDIASVAQLMYPAAAVFIGALGSFITGTGLGSNIMFAPLHTQASQMLGINPVTVFAGQNAGASLGNLICPNNTVAACATVNEIGNESRVMKKTIPAFAIIAVIYGALTMLYTFI